MKVASINYQELAFIMSITSKESKNIFSEKLEKEKIGLSDLLSTTQFVGCFGELNSVDSRYDGLDKFSFYFDQVSSSWRKFLNEKSFVKNKKMSGGKTIFYKVLNDTDLEFIKSNLEKKHLFVYGKEKHRKNNES